ncbi:hypothetical protein R3P38DRAFT_3495591 [Favolaschia claudopus]|uniref:Uncharacterized protein n=1 Tax=Favolaschia claudopus TaxID=2862362 RepID=A0AAV9Z5T1_9AGAR
MVSTSDAQRAFSGYQALEYSLHRRGESQCGDFRISSIAVYDKLQRAEDEGGRRRQGEERKRQAGRRVSGRHDDPRFRRIAGARGSTGLGSARGRDIDIVSAAGFGVVSSSSTDKAGEVSTECLRGGGSPSGCPISVTNTLVCGRGVWHTHRLVLVILDVDVDIDISSPPPLIPLLSLSDSTLSEASTRAELVLPGNEAEMRMRRCRANARWPFLAATAAGSSSIGLRLERDHKALPVATWERGADANEICIWYELSNSPQDAASDGCFIDGRAGIWGRGARVAMNTGGYATWERDGDAHEKARGVLLSSCPQDVGERAFDVSMGAHMGGGARLQEGERMVGIWAVGEGGAARGGGGGYRLNSSDRHGLVRGDGSVWWHSILPNLYWAGGKTTSYRSRGVRTLCFEDRYMIVGFVVQAVVQGDSESEEPECCLSYLIGFGIECTTLEVGRQLVYVSPSSVVFVGVSTVVSPFEAKERCKDEVEN